MLLARFDGQTAVAHADIVRDVILQLLIASAARVDDEFPFRQVEGIPVELVAPHEAPIAGSIRSVGCGDGEKNQSRQCHPEGGMKDFLARFGRHWKLGRPALVASSCIQVCRQGTAEEVVAHSVDE